ncbi:MAG: CHASE2 domain-containing protein [Candidatus Fervidibacter sp.]|uniref:CHASE2 domain-containing protein n=1 Tax=Candidatus Fervidibacter sp. TaxID=3100871 RepID=UPI0040493C7E
MKSALDALREQVQRWLEDQRLRALVLTAIVAAVVGVPWWFVAPRVELLTVDLRFRVRELLGRTSLWSQDFVIVAIDEESARELPMKVPTPRDYLARLVDRIAAYNPCVIAIDILLDRPTNPKADRQLAEAIRRAGNVVLPYQQRDGGPKTLLPIYQKAAKALGFADVPSDPDAVVRRMMVYHPVKGKRVLSFPAAIYEVATGKSVHEIGIGHSFLINFHSTAFLDPKACYPARNFFVDPPPPREIFEGKVVLIGVTHPDTRDSYFVTPFYQSLVHSGRHFATGVHIVAQALNTMLTRQFLWEPPQWLVWLMALALALLTFALLSRFAPILGFLLAIGESVFVIVIIIVAFIWTNLVLPFTPMLVSIGVGMLGALLYHFLWTRQVLKAAQERMVQMEKMKALSELASGVTHDVRNALSSVTMATELLLDEVTDEEWRKNLLIIQQGVQDAIDIVNRLRLFGKRTSEQEVLMPINLNELVTNTVTFTRAKWFYEPMKRGLEVKVDTQLSPDLPPVMGNPTELRQVLVNLIFNAVEAMPQGGVLTIRTWREGNNACIAVQDTGIGMSKEVKRRIFDPFFTTKGEQGTGLGLSICYGIVTRHKGTIEVESELGKGTTFTIRLPIAREVSEPLTELTLLPPLRVLIIDDDETVASALAEVLQKSGHKVDIATSGISGLQLFKPNAYEVVIVDWLIPGMDGLEVARKIREMAPLQPIVLTTAWQSQLDVKAVSSIVDAVIPKPWTLRSLWEALRQAFHAQRIVKQN